MGARLYTDPNYTGLKNVLMARRFRAVAAPGSMDVLTVKVEGGGDGARAATIRTYSTRAVRGVPANVSGVVVRLAIHHARPLQPAPEHLHAALAAGSLVVIWGVMSDVRYVAAQIPDVGFPLTSVDLAYYVKGRVAGILACQQLLLRVIGTTGQLVHQVCFTALGDVFFYTPAFACVCVV